MEKLRMSVLSVLLIIVLLSACGPAEIEPVEVEVTVPPVEVEVTVPPEKVEVTVEVTTEPGQPKYGGALTVAVPNIVHLDVNDVNQFGLNEIAQLFYETLVDRNASGEIEPLLIDEIDISDDGLVHTWTLQEGVRFHDGTEFNAEAVKWNLERKIDKTQPMWDLIPFEKIEAVDELTVEVTLSEPRPGIYNILHVKTFSMYSPSFVEEVGDDELKNQASGTGPFVVEEYVPNELLRVKKNTNYWRDDLPYLDEVILRVIPDEGTRANMIEAGDAHVAGYLSIQTLERFKLIEEVDVLTGESSRHYYMALNTSTPLLEDVLVRKAINHAVDKEGMADTVFRGYVSPAKAVLITPAVAGYAEGGYYEYDPDKARDLLEEAGWTDTDGDGIREKDGEAMILTLRTRKGTTPGDIERAELVQGMLGEVGIEVNIDIVDTATFLAELNREVDETYPVYHLCNLSWGTFTGDARYVMETYYSCDAWPPRFWDYSFYCNEDVDQMIDEAHSAATLEERNAIYADIIKQVWDDAATLILFDGVSTVAARGNVKGLYVDPAQTVWPVKYAWLE